DAEMPQAAYVTALESVDGLRKVVEGNTRPGTPAETASMMELALEALHQHSLLGKDALADGATYSDMVGSVLSGLGSFRPDDDEDDEDEYPRRGGRR
ncbi:MAG TPA: magnesium chelatase, partial [Rubricoccaceae bacterium]